MIINIHSILDKYGWTAKLAGFKTFEVSNSKGMPVFTIEHNKKRYVFKDTGGNKLMSGNGQLNVSLEKLLTQYYYCKAI